MKKTRSLEDRLASLLEAAAAKRPARSTAKVPAPAPAAKPPEATDALQAVQNLDIALKYVGSVLKFVNKHGRSGEYERLHGAVWDIQEVFSSLSAKAKAQP